MKKNKKKSLTEEDIRVRTTRYMGILLEQDVKGFIEKNKITPYDSHSFTEELFWLLKKRHMENNPMLAESESGFEDSYASLTSAYAGVPERLKVLRSGNQKFGPTSVRYPLKQRDVSFSVRYWEQNYQKIESGKMGMSPDVLIRLCSFYHLPADVIMFGYHPFGAPKASGETLKEKDEMIRVLKDAMDSYKEQVEMLKERLAEKGRH